MQIPFSALAFPDSITGRHFRGFLKLHSRYGPLVCQTHLAMGLPGRL
jgi:hypothetical protein